MSDTPKYDEKGMELYRWYVHKIAQFADGNPASIAADADEFMALDLARRQPSVPEMIDEVSDREKVKVLQKKVDELAEKLHQANHDRADALAKLHEGLASFNDPEVSGR